MMNRFLTGLMAVLLSMLTVISCAQPNTIAAGVDRYNAGVAFLEEGEYDNAIIEFKAALREDPNNFEAQKNLAGAYLYQDNWVEARDNYLAARDMNPLDPSVFANLALVYQHLGEPELAWENVSKAKDIDDRYPLMHYRAGELFMAQGYSDEAVAAFGDAIRLEPDGSRLAASAQGHINTILGIEPEEEVVEEIPEEELTEETEELEEIEEIEEIEEEVVEEEEEIVEEEVDDTPEEEIVEEPEPEDIVDETEDDAVVEEEIDETESDEDETAEEDAEEEEEVVEDVVPELPELEGDELYNDRLSRGRQMRARGSYSAAIQLLLEAYDVHPDYAQINYELGITYFYNGQHVLAKPMLEKYVEIGTDPTLKALAEEKLEEINGTG